MVAAAVMATMGLRGWAATAAACSTRRRAAQTISNDTIAGNSAGSGGTADADSDGGFGGNAGNGAGGGGLVNGGGTLVLVDVTVASNLSATRERPDIYLRPNGNPGIQAAAAASSRTAPPR